MGLLPHLQILSTCYLFREAFLSHAIETCSPLLPSQYIQPLPCFIFLHSTYHCLLYSYFINVLLIIYLSPVEGQGLLIAASQCLEHCLAQSRSLLIIYWMVNDWLIGYLPLAPTLDSPCLETILTPLYANTRFKKISIIFPPHFLGLSHQVLKAWQFLGFVSHWYPALNRCSVKHHCKVASGYLGMEEKDKNSYFLLTLWTIRYCKNQ